MGERNQAPGADSQADEDLLDPVLGEFFDEEFADVDTAVTACDHTSLAAKRRRAEQRLEALRLREELGDYEFEFDDDF